MKIMIADDEDLIRLGLEKICLREVPGAEIVGSHRSGAEAWNRLSTLPPGGIDALITDIRMPVMDGFELIRRSREIMPNLPVIVLSGFNDFEYARRALRFGVTDYLLKPIDKPELLALLTQIRSARKKEEELSAGSDAPETESSPDHYAVERLKSMIESEYAEPLEFAELAERLGMNPSYVSRLFKLETGQTLTDYLIALRMDRAKRLLVEQPELKNYEVAEKVGYGDPVHFNKLFKKIVGMTPKDYKNNAFRSRS
ncbi:helix-turn-helix domain-containing protein [Saccharibacillus alkalitolerans]|uniref:Response regulator n=1 Tax=Saccharibacillus alkalitolerans TaxID=2705290 RepID=A0ABX0F3W2_9BACL|nr:helix-turn-helix domain-containing protein [Saccharibacillus alkalitolerans]NGZ75332.1 response regulator [Saccharibacillus alkalitolerans]